MYNVVHVHVHVYVASSGEVGIFIIQFIRYVALSLNAYIHSYSQCIVHIYMYSYHY